jgi:hypothetical protein
MLSLALDWLPVLLGGGGAAAIVGIGFRLFTGGSIKIWLYAAVALAIAGLVAYHFILTGRMRLEAANLRTELVQVKADKEKALASNASLEEANKALKDTGRQILQELANVRAADNNAQAQVSAAIARANDAERRVQLERLRSSRGVERLLSTVNKSANCDMMNFGKDGECKAGVFIPRVAP